MSKTFILTGKNGDIFDILPILYHEFVTTKEKPILLVSKEFAPAVSNLDFVHPHLWPGPWIDLKSALLYAKQNFDDVVCASCYGHEFPIQYQCPSFQLEHWRRAGYLSKWGELARPVIKTDVNGALSKWIPKQPTILFSDHGVASPFPHREQLARLLHDRFGQTHQIVRLSEIRLPCVTDLVALYDAADALVVIDTMHLHLSVATTTPVLAFNTDRPKLANGSAYHTRFQFLCRYSDFETRQGEFIGAMHDALWKRQHSLKLVHLWSHSPNPWDVKNGADHRMRVAAETWKAEAATGHWVEHRFLDSHAKHTSADIGDVRSLPTINEMIDHACIGRHHKDIIVLTNADTCFASGLTDLILNTVTKKGAMFGHRWDFPKLDRQLTVDEIKSGAFYPGSDVFCFEVGWWKNYCRDYPTMYLATECWDLVLRHLIRQTGGGELKHAICHQWHGAHWHSHRHDPAAVHNRRNADEFMKRWSLMERDW